MVDTDLIAHSADSDLGLHCLLKSYEMLDIRDNFIFMTVAGRCVRAWNCFSLAAILFSFQHLPSS